MPNRKKHTAQGRTKIAGHTQQGSKLLPPMAALPNLYLASWINDRLPEMLWAVLIVNYFEQSAALRLMARGINYLGEKRLEKEANSKDDSVNVDCDVTHTGLSQMDADLLRGFLTRLTPDDECRAVLRPLLLLNDLPARQAWADAIGMEAEPDDWQFLMQSVAASLDHQSQEATDCRYARVMAMCIGGRLHVLPEMVDELVAYPNVDLRIVRPTIRSVEGALAAASHGSSNPVWPAKFWEQCYCDTECWSLQIEPVTPAMPQTGTTVARVQEVKRFLVDHCNQTRTTTAVDARHDTVFGVGLYSFDILEELLRIGIGNTISARFGLRSLVDNLITLAYLAHKDEPQLWQSYRVFGAGQAKLQYLKLDDDPTKPSYVNIETLQNLANEDAWEEYLQIELGHWEKSNTRKMSEEAGVKDFYDRFYAWTSTYAHGHWGAVRNTVFDTCGNPLHRLHRIPRASPRFLQDAVPDAAACTDRILEVICFCYPGFAHRITI